MTTYILRNTQNQTIQGYAATPIFSAGTNQVIETLEGVSFEDYAARLRLTCDKTRIKPDGQDAALVIVSSNIPDLTSIDILVDELLIPVTLVNGIGQLPPIVSDAVGSISVRAADAATYAVCGWGGLTIAVTDED